MLAVLAAFEADLHKSARRHPTDPPILVGLFGPGAAAVRSAAVAVYPKAEPHLINLYAVRGVPDQPGEDPLPRGIWPVLCPAYLPRTPSLPPLTLTPPTPGDLRWASSLRWLAGGEVCVRRQLLASICGDDAEAAYLPPDARLRVTALPRLMDSLGHALTLVASPGADLEILGRFDPTAKFRVLDEVAEAACELALVARIHLIAFYARIRPAPTGGVHRAAAALLRHRRRSIITPATLTSGVTAADLRDLFTAGWLDPHEFAATRSGRHSYVPSDAFRQIRAPELPRKRPSRPQPICVVSDGAE